MATAENKITARTGGTLRVKSFGVQRVGPVQMVTVENLSDVVVFAGPNGVGKTNVNNALLTLARNPVNSATDLPGFLVPGDSRNRSSG